MRPLLGGFIQEKNNKIDIQWTDDLIRVFENSKLAVKHIKPLYLPKRSDQLAVTLDWSKQGIGGTLWALLDKFKTSGRLL